MNHTDIKNRELVIGIRQALLMVVDLLEKWLDMTPTTAQIRKEGKRGN